VIKLGGKVFFMSGKNTRHVFCPSGFTLLEILIAIFILSVVLTTAFVSYRYSLRIVHDITYEQEIYKMARISLDRMIKDLSSLQKSEEAFFLQSEENIIGGRKFQSLTFWSAAHLDFDEKAVEQRPTTISYFARKNESGESFSLIRNDLPGVVPAVEKRDQRGFVICENIYTLNFKFYDAGGGETEFWDSLSSSSGQKGKAPVAVKIEIALANKNDAEKPYKFMTTTFLPAGTRE